MNSEILKVDTIIKTLFSIENKKSLSISKLYSFYNYLRSKIEKDKKPYIFSSNYEDIKRYIYYNSEVFDLINEELIVAKGIIEIKEENKWLKEICKEFIKQY